MVVAGEGDGVAGWVLRGRCWSLLAVALDPKTNPMTIKQQIANTPVRLRFCSLDNTQLTPLKPQNNSQIARLLKTLHEPNDRDGSVITN